MHIRQISEPHTEQSERERETDRDRERKERERFVSRIRIFLYAMIYKTATIWSIKIAMFSINYLKTTETKIAEFANSVDFDDVAHNEPPHLVLHCMSSSL